MDYAKPTTRVIIYLIFKPEIGKYIGFDHVLIWCGNAKQAANFYVTRLGFNTSAYQVRLTFFMF
jgi:catechol-2,3-dioxygenase